MQESLTSLSDLRLILHFHDQLQQSINNIPLDEIARASQPNHTSHYQERLITQLNNVTDVSQDIRFEEMMARYHTEYRNAGCDAIKVRMLKEINRESRLLIQQNSTTAIFKIHRK